MRCSDCGTQTTKDGNCSWCEPLGSGCCLVIVIVVFVVAFVLEKLT